MDISEIQKLNKQMMKENSGNYCKNGGKVQLVYKDISLNSQSGAQTSPQAHAQYDQKYICTCPYNFMGFTCEECAKGYFGQHCHPCPKHPINNIV